MNIVDKIAGALIPIALICAIIIAVSVTVGFVWTIWRYIRG